MPLAQPRQTPLGEDDIHFHKKHVWSMQNNIFCGITFPAWVRLLVNRRNDIEWRTYWFRVLFITLLSMFNSIVALLETIMYGRKIANTKLNKQPVFVIGHQRTGTTHLYNCLSKDSRFVYPTTFNCAVPSAFFIMEPLKRMMAGMVSETRPMDNMKLDLDSPQEDELATNVLCSGVSPNIPNVFIHGYQKFCYLFDPKNIPDPENKAWTDAFMYFIKKVTLRGGDPNKHLLLKSPTHTARVKFLLQLFPDAQFIYIHRNPYQIFRSYVNMADTTFWYFNLNTPSDEDMVGLIREQFQCILDAFLEARDSIPDGNLYILSFEDLDSQPLESLEKIYRHFKWNFDNMRPNLEAYIASLGKFKKNHDSPLGKYARDLVNIEWDKYFEAFGYEKIL